MKTIILAAALIAFCSPAFAGGKHHGGGGNTVGSTHASSKSGVLVSGRGNSLATAVGANSSYAYSGRAPGPGIQSVTGSFSYGGGLSAGHGKFEGFGTGTASAHTLGSLSGGHQF